MTPLAALRAAFGDRVVHERAVPSPATTPSGIAAASTAARGADVAIVFVGGESGLQPHSTVGEARDATSLALTGVQQQLVDAVIDTGTPTVVVLVSGRVHTRPGDRRARRRRSCRPGCPARRAATASPTCSPARSTRRGGCRCRCRAPSARCRCYAVARAGGGRSMFYGDYTDSPDHAAVPLRSRPLVRDLRADGRRRSSRAARRRSRWWSRRRPGTPATGPASTWSSCSCNDDVASVARHQFALCGFARVPLEPGRASERSRFTVDPSRLAFYDPQHALRRRARRLHVPDRRGHRHRRTSPETYWAVSARRHRDERARRLSHHTRATKVHTARASTPRCVRRRAPPTPCGSGSTCRRRSPAPGAPRPSPARAAPPRTGPSRRSGTRSAR